MLVLTRKKNEEIVLGSGDQAIVVRILEIGPDRVKIGLTAPETVNILRRELLLEPEREQSNAKNLPCGKKRHRR